MKRFNVIPKQDGNHIVGYAVEAKFDVISKSEDRAFELLKQLGENPDDYELMETFGVTNQLGRFFPESITTLY